MHWSAVGRAVAWFALALVVVGVSGVVVAVRADAGGDFDPVLHYELHGLGASLQGLALFVIEALVLAILASRRRRPADWIGAYAGVVLGIVPFFALYAYFSAAACGPGYICAPIPNIAELIRDGFSSALTMAAPVAGIIFALVGAIAAARRPASGHEARWGEPDAAGGAEQP